MDRLIEPGYAVIALLQQYRSAPADALFVGLSLLGEELFYLLLVPPLYWLLDKRLATRFSVLFLLSVYFNMLFKGVLDQPRPSPQRVEVLIADPGEGGLPSGHAQNAVVTWGFLAGAWPHRWLKVLFVGLIVGIGVSRVYLGVHYPHDVLGGWAIGSLILLLYFVAAPRLTRALLELPPALRIVFGSAAAFVLMVAYTGGVALVAMATLLGLSAGVPVERTWIRYDARWLGGWRSVARLAIGFAVVFLLWQGLRELMLPLGAGGTVLRYALLGFWISAGAPWLFVRAGLGRREPETSRLSPA